MNKEEKWKLDRMGRPTSSKLDDLFTGGSRPSTPEELAAYKLVKSLRKTVDIEFGATAINYLYQLKRERRIKKPHYERSNYNFDYGNEQEVYAVKWLRANHPELIIRHCSSDDFEEIVFNVHESGLGDSPDGYVNNDTVLEIKCPVDENKIEEIMDMTKSEAKKEYARQFAGHFLCAPWATELLYVVYDGMKDDDPNDLRDPLSPDRGIIFTYSREEFTELIAAIEAKVKYVISFLDVVDRGELKADGTKLRIRDINSWSPLNA